MAKTAHEADDGQVNLDFDEEPQEVLVQELLSIFLENHPMVTLNYRLEMEKRLVLLL